MEEVHVPYSAFVACKESTAYLASFQFRVVDCTNIIKIVGYAKAPKNITSFHDFNECVTRRMAESRTFF